MTALISTIASTTTEPGQSSLEAVTQRACASLVKHYSDPIHAASSDGDDENELPVLYFHDENSSLPCLPPVCDFWYRKLLEIGNSELELCEEEFNPISLAITRELLYCYESIIRPVLIDDSSTSSVNVVMKVIEHYELLLAYFATSTSCDVDGVVKSLDKVHLCNNNNENSGALLQIGRIIYSISQEISERMSKIPSNDNETTKKIQNEVFPYLLRLMGHCLTLLISSSHCIIDAKNTTDLTAFKAVLSIATVTCVPFVGDGRLNSGNFGIGTLIDWILESTKDDTNCNPISIAAALKCCSPSPHSVKDDSDLISSSSFMQRPVIDWSARSAHFVAPWSDGVDGVSFRAAVRVLKQIHTASLTAAPLRGNACDGNEHSTTDIVQLLQSISRNVGVEVLTSTVRAFFYGRLSYPSASTPNVSAVASKPVGSYMPMVRRIGVEKREPENQKPDTDTFDLTKERNKFRVSAATLIFCAVLSQHSSFKACDSALSDAIPIALTLLDDVQSFHQGLGAAIVLSAIESLSHFGPDSLPSFVAKFNPFLTSAFETAVKHGGREEALLITAICFAQSKWIQYLSTLSQHPDCIIPQATVKALARKATTDMMHTVMNQSQFGGRNGNDERIAGMLVAGVNPLLALLANSPDAASIEIARVGLSALLPLIGWRGSSLESHAIHISSMTCLISLMNGAYPIMMKHGGKILTEIMLLLDRTDKDTKYLSETNSNFPCDSDNHTSANVTMNVALYCGAVSLIICGESAEAVVQHVKSTNLEKPIEQCRKICDLSKKILRP